MRSNYDDLMGLDMYDDGMSGLFDADMFKEQLIAAGSSAVAIIAAAWGMPKIPAPKDWTEVNQHRLRAVLGVLAGMAASRGLWDYNRGAAMAVLGGVGGLGLAQLLDTYLDMDLLRGSPLGAYPDSGSLSQGDEALLSAYGRDNGAALAALEMTNVRSAPGAFSGFSGPVVSNEALMGAVVQAETLGAYNPYMA